MYGYSDDIHDRTLFGVYKFGNMPLRRIIAFLKPFPFCASLEKPVIARTSDAALIGKRQSYFDDYSPLIHVRTHSDTRIM